MRIAFPTCILLTSLVLGSGGAFAQSPSTTAPAAAVPTSQASSTNTRTPSSPAAAPGREVAKSIPPGSLNAASPPGKSGADQLIERITVDDGGARISELRFGGETRSITVQPKGGMPAYDVRPISGADIQPTSGTRTWKILGF